MIVPKEEPLLKNLRSSYLILRKLVEHCQEVFGSGVIHLKSRETEGAIFFEGGRFLEAIFQSGQTKAKGERAIGFIEEAATNDNLQVDIYRIPPEKVRFWASLHTAEPVYENLSTEFIDFEAFLRKMEAEKLTGFVEVAIQGGKEGGLLFFDSGKMIGGSYSWDKEVSSSQENRQLILKKAKELGGTLHVRRISSASEVEVQPKAGKSRESSSSVLPMLEELLGTFESEIMKQKKIKERFHTLLKNKFIEKADRYVFLNPFSGEFEYSDRKISWTGKAGEDELVRGVVESVKELAEELGLVPFLKGKFPSWAQTYARELQQLGLSL